MLRFFLNRSLIGFAAATLLAACGGGSGAPPFAITSGSPPNGATGVAYPGFTSAASNGVAPVSWSESGALPPGMSLNAAGQLSGTPVTAGTYSFTVAASDSSSPPLDATTMVTIQISDSLIVINTAQLPPSGTASYPYAGYTFTVASGGSPPFTWKVTAGAVPPGLAFGNDGSLSGTPTSTGSYTFTVAATDGAPSPETESAPFTIIINGPGAPTVSAVPPPPSGTVSYPYAGFGFAANGGLPPYTWAVTTGAVPAGLTLDPGGTLSGTPTTVGTVMFTVTATDSAVPPETGSQPFSMTVNTPGPPIINLVPAPPAATADTSYGPDGAGFQFTATGGYLPFSWAVTAGAVPSGLTFGSDGLTGVPTAIGSFSFTVTVTDSAPTPEMNSAPFTITITAPPPPIINAVVLPTGTTGTAYGPITFAASSGYLPLVWSETGALPTGVELSAAGMLSGTPQNDGQFPITLEVTDALSRSAPGAPITVRVSMARPAAAFTPTTGSMTVARDGHTATLLQSGQVLIAGGSTASAGLQSAELYNPANQTFAATGSMTIARSGHTATLLADAALPDYGDVLIAGGGSQTAELYDPTAGTFTATGSMVAPHTGLTATLLQNGQVLIAGGQTAAAELFNPTTGTFTATGSLTVERTEHTATLLVTGQVLIAGGANAGGPTATTELYDPVSGTFTATGSMSEARSGHTATLLADASTPNYGTVIIAGPDATAEAFDPATGTFSLVGNLLTAPGGSTATLRNDGTVLVAGGTRITRLGRLEVGGYNNTLVCVYGATSVHVSLAATDLFAPESEGFTATGPLRVARASHTATLLADGTVLVTGGLMDGVVTNDNCPIRGTSTVLSSAELYK